MKVAIQGERGSFSHQAALELVPKSEIVACSRATDVFDAVESGEVQCAVLPVENTLAGTVGEHLDLLMERNVFVQQEHRLRIEHNLIAAPGVKIKDVKKVVSHPIALDQCRKFFHKHPEIEPVAFYDTVGGVKHVISNKLTDTAAIAGQQAAGEYGGRVLQAGLEDVKENFTRFFRIVREKAVLPLADKTSIVFSLTNVSGALFKALSVFSLRDIDLSKIESRPVRGKPWEYMFYADVLRGEEPVLDRALVHLAEVADFIKVIGIYPRAR
ncbi:MAG: prephenate dehydratase [Acidobacteriia bacterium]|nr:prephenate dehydratase [Terriglobia bacterium]